MWNLSVLKQVFRTSCCDVCDIKIINPLNLQFLQGVCENVWGTCKRGYGIHRLLPQSHEADVYQPPHMVLLMMHSCDLRVQPHIFEHHEPDV